jgi:hypothetical protein
LILAAGRGTRYKGLKQLDAVGPNLETIAEYSIYDACKAGFKKVVFVIAKEMSARFEKEIFARLPSEIDIACAFQEIDAIPEGFQIPADRAKPWGTGHAVWTAKDSIFEPFAVINADDFYGTESFGAVAEFLVHTQSGGALEEYAMVGFDLYKTLSQHGPVSRGICEVQEDGCLRRIEELKNIRRTQNGVRYEDLKGVARPLTGKESVSMNMWAFTPSIFRHLETGFEQFLCNDAASPEAEYYLPYAVNELIQKGIARVKVLATESAWFGITYGKDRSFIVENIDRLISQGKYPGRLWRSL